MKNSNCKYILHVSTNFEEMIAIIWNVLLKKDFNDK